MDDGLQNPGLAKTMSLLVVDGVVGFGNGRVLPAGPLREPVAAAAARCRACVAIGPGRVETGLPVLHAELAPERSLAGERVFGFCGIARPGKFRDTLREAGAELAGWAEFPDHHVFAAAELERVGAAARRLGASLITTAKDAVRLPAAFAVQVLAVRLVWRDPGAVDRLLDELLA